MPRNLLFDAQANLALNTDETLASLGLSRVNAATLARRERGSYCCHHLIARRNLFGFWVCASKRRAAFARRCHRAITLPEGSHPDATAGCVSRLLKGCRVRPITSPGRSGSQPHRIPKPRGSGRAERSAPLTLPCDRLSESCGLYKFTSVHCRRALTLGQAKTRVPALPRFRAPRRAGPRLFSSPTTPRRASSSLPDAFAFQPPPG
jgi:hypothetical protein